MAIFQLLSWFKQSSMLATKQSTVAHQFVLPTSDGATISLQANQRKTVVYFFAPWCSICDISIDNLQSLYEKNPNIDVIAVALDYVDQKQVLNFSSEHQLTFPVVYGNEQIKTAYKIQAYPSYYVLNEESTIISKSMGYSTELGLYLRSL